MFLKCNICFKMTRLQPVMVFNVNVPYVWIMMTYSHLTMKVGQLMGHNLEMDSQLSPESRNQPLEGQHSHHQLSQVTWGQAKATAIKQLMEQVSKSMGTFTI